MKNKKIIKCDNKNCPNTYICYRYLASGKEDDIQGYETFEYDKETGLCEYYLPVYDPY